MVMLLFLNPFVFVLPREGMSYTVTIFLSLVVFMTLVSQNMHSSEKKTFASNILFPLGFYDQILAKIACITFTFMTSKSNTRKRLIKQKQKYQGMFETQKSINKTSPGDNGLNIRTLASPKVGQDQVSGGEASSVGMPHPLQMFYGNLSQLGEKSNSVIRSRSVIGSKTGVMPDQWRVSL